MSLEVLDLRGAALLRLGVIGGIFPSAGVVTSAVRRSCQSRSTTQNWL